MKTTDPDLWTCKRCGLRLRDCRCSYRRIAGVLGAAGVMLALLATPMQAQTAPPPIIGPGAGPCHSDTPHWCYAHQVWLPLVAVAP
jgi:hypothetical protein